MLTKRIHRKSTSTKTIQIKSWYIRHINYTVKLCKSQRKTNYTRQNEKSLGRLAGVTMLDYDSTLVIIYSKSKLEVIKDSITFCISLMMVKNLHHNW